MPPKLHRPPRGSGPHLIHGSLDPPMFMERFPPVVSETAAWSPMVRSSLKWSTSADCSDFTVSSPIPSTHLGIWAYGSTWRRHTGKHGSSAPHQRYHSTDLLTARGVAHLVVHRTSGSNSYETIPHVWLETSGDVLSTVDMVVQRRDGPHWLCELDDEDVHTPNGTNQLSCHSRAHSCNQQTHTHRHQPSKGHILCSA